jgi:hypothetical protein
MTAQAVVTTHATLAARGPQHVSIHMATIMKNAQLNTGSREREGSEKSTISPKISTTNPITHRRQQGNQETAFLRGQLFEKLPGSYSGSATQADKKGKNGPSSPCAACVSFSLDKSRRERYAQSAHSALTVQLRSRALTPAGALRGHPAAERESREKIYHLRARVYAKRCATSRLRCARCGYCDAQQKQPRRRRR